VTESVDGRFFDTGSFANIGAAFVKHAAVELIAVGPEVRSGENDGAAPVTLGAAPSFSFLPAPPIRHT
jgi:hypothetical protein